MAGRRLLIYALGSGFGHLTRASALARAGLPDTQVRILTNSPYADFVKHALPELDLVAFDPAMSMDQARVEILRQIASAAECLIVDTFPRGLGGELADVLPTFAGRKVFVQRDLNPRYAASYNLGAFIARAYDLVLVPGDSTPDNLGPFPQTVITAPWLIRAQQEILSRDRARDFLGLHDERPCIVICAAGNSEELGWYGAVVSELLTCEPECAVRCVAPVRPDTCPPGCSVRYWPAMDLYAAADVLIGGAGYNTVYEAAACGVPLVARAWPRKYDRQNLRARRAARTVHDPKQAAIAALELLRAGPKQERPIQFKNGAEEAIAKVRALV